MKKSMVLRFIILICCINLYLVASYAQTLSDELVFEERVFDFGEIKEENGLVSHEFEFKNVSQKVISINGVTSVFLPPQCTSSQTVAVLRYGARSANRSPR